MTDPGYAEEHPHPEEAPVNDTTVRVLVWLLLGAILFILMVAIVTAAKSLLTLMAGATTLIAVAALAIAVVLAVRVVRLEERIRTLEQERHP